MISARACSVNYGRIDALNNVSLEAETGIMTGIIGPNGAGKTTLIKCLAGLRAPTCGEVEVDGRALIGMSPRERAALIAYVPQTVELPFAYRALEVVLMGVAARLKPFAFESERDIEAAYAALTTTDAQEFAGRYFHELSGGERQRVVLARALVQQTPAMLLDEPTASLDLSHAVNFYRMLKKRCIEGGTTVIAAMHDLNMAALFCDRLVLLDHGSVIAEGEPHDVLTEDIIARVFGIGVEVVLTRDGMLRIFPRP